MRQKNSRKTVKVLQHSIAAAIALLCVSACGEQKKKPVAVSHEQSDLFFEITSESTLCKYGTVLPKIKRYGVIEKESSFWLDLESMTATNHYVVLIRQELDKGDYEGAEKLVDEMFVKYGTGESRVAIRNFISALRKTNETISALHNSISSADIRKHCAELREHAQYLPGNGKIVAFAAAKEAAAAELEKLEKYRPLFWLYGDALEERAKGNVQTADLITALIAADNDPLDGARNAMVKELMNNGMFNVVVPDFKYRTGEKETDKDTE